MPKEGQKLKGAFSLDTATQLISDGCKDVHGREACPRGHGAEKLTSPLGRAADDSNGLCSLAVIELDITRPRPRANLHHFGYSKVHCSLRVCQLKPKTSAFRQSQNTSNDTVFRPRELCNSALEKPSPGWTGQARYMITLSDREQGLVLIHWEIPAYDFCRKTGYICYTDLIKTFTLLHAYIILDLSNHSRHLLRCR